MISTFRYATETAGSSRGTPSPVNPYSEDHNRPYTYNAYSLNSFGQHNGFGLQQQQQHLQHSLQAEQISRQDHQNDSPNVPGSQTTPSAEEVAWTWAGDFNALMNDRPGFELFTDYLKEQDLGHFIEFR